jgi:hypothetical protein
MNVRACKSTTRVVASGSIGLPRVRSLRAVATEWTPVHRRSSTHRLPASRALSVALELFACHWFHVLTT